MDKIFEAIAGALGGSAAQTAVGAVNALIGGNINENFSERAEERAYARQLDMYQRMYHDNSPANKRAQLEQAGLNPALMYGGATSAGGGTVQTGSPVQGTVNTKLDLPNVMEISQVMKQNELMSAQIAKTEEEARLAKVQADKLAGADTDKVKADIDLINNNINNIKADTALKNSQIELNEFQKTSIDIANQFNKENNVQLLKNNIAIGRKLIAEATVSERTIESVVATIKQNFKIALSQELLNKANIRLKDIEIQEIANNITVANKQVQINREKMENDLNIGIKANNNGIISKDVKGIANTLIEAFSGQEDYFK